MCRPAAPAPPQRAPEPVPRRLRQFQLSMQAFACVSFLVFNDEPDYQTTCRDVWSEYGRLAELRPSRLRTGRL